MEQDILFVATFAFVFVTLVVGGLRAMRIIEQHKAKVEADRIARMKERATRTNYTGGYFNVHGNQID
jgi:NhaP-type Na+/H+ or K+/H+ antiporter